MIQALQEDGAVSISRDFVVDPGRKAALIIENAEEPEFLIGISTLHALARTADWVESRGSEGPQALSSGCACNV
jgi:hypothetical protein